MKHAHILVLFLMAACGAQKPKTESVPKAAAQAPIGAAGIDYAALYCANAVKLKLRTDITTEIDLICKDGKPTELMQEYRTRALAQEPGKIDIKFLQQKSTEETDRSEFTVIWAFHVPIRPFIVKARPLYDYIAKGYQNADVSFAVKANRLMDAPLDSGLHLWTTEMDYALRVNALPSLAITNDRKTQYNLYQVLSGNEEMGMGVEHLVASPDQTYKVSNLVNFSFNDGDGYNDGKGGTIVINILRFDFNNQGFPNTAIETMTSVAQALANNMYEGLKQ
ncbi:MAG TPA: hypothetical protein VFO10_12935 [Oligoflexus sp.]|uniref:hypothetical protein n=1 Tax=Oligoflexus sp. TaxID=1971216 RepID=UPI002D809837|nr:hypothetical protein [Oligoflexus sp.]HET9238157.1 hypothetical protein [Oligoflexus sp.]